MYRLLYSRTTIQQQGIRIPSQRVCTELHNMGFSTTILSLDQVYILSNGPLSYTVMIIYLYQMDVCNITNDDFTTFTKSKTKERTNTGAKIKYVVPKLGVKNSPGPVGLKKRAARNSISFNHHPKRSQAKISVKKTKKITKPEAIRPSLSHKKNSSHHKQFMVPNSQMSHCDIEEPKAVVTVRQPGRILSKKSLLQNHALLLSNTDSHDSNLQYREENTSIRYSRRMPVFPPVSSSHVNTQPVTSNQCRVSLVGEGGSKKPRFTRLTAGLSMERKCSLSPPKLSVISLKLPNIIN